MLAQSAIYVSAFSYIVITCHFPYLKVFYLLNTVFEDWILHTIIILASLQRFVLMILEAAEDDMLSNNMIKSHNLTVPLGTDSE